MEGAVDWIWSLWTDWPWTSIYPKPANGGGAGAGGRGVSWGWGLCELRGGKAESIQCSVLQIYQPFNQRIRLRREINSYWDGFRIQYHWLTISQDLKGPLRQISSDFLPLGMRSHEDLCFPHKNLALLPCPTALSPPRYFSGIGAWGVN